MTRTRKIGILDNAISTPKINLLMNIYISIRKIDLEKVNA